MKKICVSCNKQFDTTEEHHTVCVACWYKEKNEVSLDLHEDYGDRD